MMEIVALVLFLAQVMAWAVLPASGYLRKAAPEPQITPMSDALGGVMA